MAASLNAVFIIADAPDTRVSYSHEYDDRYDDDDGQVPRVPKPKHKRTYVRANGFSITALTP